MGRIGCPETAVQNYHSTLKKAFFLDFLTLEDGTDRLSRNVQEVREEGFLLGLLDP
jgi:hypothetical protein